MATKVIVNIPATSACEKKVKEYIGFTSHLTPGILAKKVKSPCSLIDKKWIEKNTEVYCPQKNLGCKKIFKEDECLATFKKKLGKTK